MTPPDIREWRLALDSLAAEGLADPMTPPYDAERWDGVARIAEQLADRDRPRHASSLEAVAKTGIALTASDIQRERFEQVLRIAIEISGIEYFGPAPPALPSAERDSAAFIGARYITPKLTVMTVVDDGSGRFLLIQRADTGAWGLPGGFVDVGMSPSENAAREVAEETGLGVNVTALLGEFDAMRHGEPRLPQVCLIYHALVAGGELWVNPHECLDARWSTGNDLPTQLHLGATPWVAIARGAVAGGNGPAYFDRPRVIDLTDTHAFVSVPKAGRR